MIDDGPINKANRPLLTVAMHPSGYYMAAGFVDKIRLYHILHNGIRPFRNVDIKGCKKIKFSNGGQWFAAVDNKFLHFYNSYTLERIGGEEKLMNEDVTDLRFNPDDTCLAICTSQGFVFRYRTTGILKKLSDDGYLDKDKDIRFTSCQFVEGDTDDCLLIGAGTDGSKGVL